MSTAKIMGRVSQLLTFTKETVINNLLESQRRGEITVDENSIRKITSIVDQSVSQSLSLAAGDVESAVVELTNANKKSTSSRRTKK